MSTTVSSEETPQNKFLRACHNYREATRLHNQAVSDATTADREEEAALATRNRAADRLDDCLMEYAAARQQRRAAGEMQAKYDSDLDAIRWKLQEAGRVLSVAAKFKTDEECLAEGAKFARCAAERAELSRREALVADAQTAAHSRLEKAAEAKKQAQSALDEADAAYETAKKKHASLSANTSQTGATESICERDMQEVAKITFPTPAEEPPASDTASTSGS